MPGSAQSTLGFMSATLPCSPNRYGIYHDSYNKLPIEIPAELRVIVTLYTALDASDGRWRAGMAVEAKGPEPIKRGQMWSGGHHALPSTKHGVYETEYEALSEAAERADEALQQLITNNQRWCAPSTNIDRLRAAREILSEAASKICETSAD